ncbi:MAG TPA: hypothetical protein VHR86_10805, partial [Armatimonadota bacterium]|nr:hypothetical protein [Armatimonadota bacterium]
MQQSIPSIDALNLLGRDAEGLRDGAQGNDVGVAGLISSSDAAAMTERESLQLIFLAGLSTSEKVTDISGRGVGMDIVHNNIQRLG